MAQVLVKVQVVLRPQESRSQNHEEQREEGIQYERSSLRYRGADQGAPFTASSTLGNALSRLASNDVMRVARQRSLSDLV
jgi:hypothetical protein